MNWEDIKVGQRIRFLHSKSVDASGSVTIVGFSGLVVDVLLDCVEISGIGTVSRDVEETFTIELLEDVPKPAELPHSRACGWRAHEHGTACHENCPTCGGKVLTPSL